VHQSDANGHWVPVDEIADLLSISYDLGYTGAATLLGSDEQVQEGLDNLALDAVGITIPYVAAYSLKMGARFAKAAKGISKNVSVWSKPPAARGRHIEAMFGGNLGDFPVIDKVVKGKATSIKSLDVASLTYGKPNRMYSRLKAYVDKLEDFKGASYNGMTYLEGKQFNKKELLLAIEKSKLTKEQSSILKKIDAYAESKGVEFNLEDIQ
jgi:hypothetical protein